MSSFIRFVLRFKNEDNSAGDLARDILADPDVKHTWGYKKFDKYLESKGASRKALEVAAQLEFYYSRMKST